MTKKVEKEVINNQSFYLSTIDNKNELWTYRSDDYSLTEFDLINLIKICLIEQRSKFIGRKLLAVYEDCTKHRIELTKQRLQAIGVKDEEESNPSNSAKYKSR